MRRYRERIEAASGNGGRIGPVKIRDLYNSFCEQMIRLSDLVDVETTSFETRFSGPGEMYVAVSPYRDIFLVSIGRNTPFEIRVSSEESCFRALDLALNHYLTSISRN